MRFSLWNRDQSDSALLHQMLLGRARLTKRLVQKVGSVVSAGPFKGMILLDETSWGDGDKLPKMVGSYEAELHTIISNVIATAYAAIVNIGCAEGYYAVGLSRAMPWAHVYAFDCNTNAKRVCKKSALANRVSDRITIEKSCTVSGLRRALERQKRTFLLSDCEGAEFDLLLSPELAVLLPTTDMLIECHDFLRPGVTEGLTRQFEKTHVIVRIEEAGRMPDQFPLLKELSGVERVLATCEFRPVLMHWLYFRSRNMRDGLANSPCSTI
jgi:hypothetical protein